MGRVQSKLILFDKANERESKTMWFLDSEGNHWIHLNPDIVDVGGHLKIVPLSSMSSQFEMRIVEDK